MNETQTSATGDSNIGITLLLEIDGDMKGRPASYLRPRREKVRIITYKDRMSGKY
jgi:hypothetical protein